MDENNIRLEDFYADSSFSSVTVFRGRGDVLLCETFPAIQHDKLINDGVLSRYAKSRESGAFGMRQSNPQDYGMEELKKLLGL